VSKGAPPNPNEEEVYIFVQGTAVCLLSSFLISGRNINAAESGIWSPTWFMLCRFGGENEGWWCVPI